MPIVKEDDALMSQDPASTPVEKPIETIRITSTSNSSVLVDNRWIPRINLITHIEGSSWNVDYYSQVLTKDSQLSGQQISVSSANQQYTKISNFVLKVTSTLTSSQKEDKSMEVTGEAIVNPSLIANEGDMFVADIGEGRLAVFEIYKTTKLSIFKEACYQISYKLISDEANRIEDLLNKTVKETVYHDSFNLFGKNPIIVKDEHSILIELHEEYRKVLEYYFKRFFSKEYKTMLVPMQSTIVYDPFLVKFLLSEFNTRDCNEIKYLIKYNTQNHDELESNSLWDSIKHRDIEYLNSSFTKYFLKDVKSLSGLVVSNGIRYSGVKKVIFPNDSKLSVDKTIDRTLPVENVVVDNQPLGNSDINLRVTNLRNLKGSNELPTQVEDGILDGYYTLLENGQQMSVFNVLSNNQTTTPNTTDPVSFINIPKNQLPASLNDGYYVLTENFYLNKVNDLSIFEGLVLRYINKESVDKTNILNICKEFHKWSLLQQFYFLPIVLTMVRSLLNGE